MYEVELSRELYCKIKDHGGIAVANILSSQEGLRHGAIHTCCVDSIVEGTTGARMSTTFIYSSTNLAVYGT